MYTAAQLAEAAEARDRAQTPAQPLQTALGTHIMALFYRAEQHKTNFIQAELDASQRQREGEYDPSLLLEIQRLGGTDVYSNITDAKCSGLEAWLHDVMTMTDSLPFSVEPTPLPTLPEDEREDIAAQVAMADQAARASGAAPMTPSEAFELGRTLYDQRLTERLKEAMTRATRMERVIADQLEEGGFHEALREFIQYLATYPTAGLKGPTFKSVKRDTWRDGRIVITDETIPTFSAPNPHDLFPAPNARRVQDSWFIERYTLHMADIQRFRGQPAWNNAEIDAILANRPIAPPVDSGDSARAALELRDVTANSGMAEDHVIVLDYWGPIQGSMLIEWGMKTGIKNPLDFYQTHALCINGRVPHAVLNPDPLDVIPLHLTSFEKRPGSFWGKSLARKMRDCQRAYNVAIRGMLDNLVFASGPQVMVNSNAFPPAEDFNLSPRRVWVFEGDKQTGMAKAIDFFQPAANVAAFLQVADFFEARADDRTLVPRYQQGLTAGTGALATASGLEMMLNASAKGIKRVLLDIGLDVIVPIIRALYRYNLKNHPDAAVKGDCRVAVRGPLALMFRETLQARRLEYLQQTNNPNDFQIMGVAGRAALHREIVKALNMPAGDIIPDEAAIQQQVATSRMEQENMLRGGLPPEQHAVVQQ